MEGKKKDKKRKPKKNPMEKEKYFHCNSNGHWKRNCPANLASLKKKREGGLSEGMLVIETNLIVSSTSNWMPDARSSAHLWTSLQGLKDSRRLRDGEMILYVRNGANVATVAVEMYPLWLPSGSILELRDYFYVPTVSKNLISISCLAQDGYVTRFYKDLFFMKEIKLEVVSW